MSPTAHCSKHPDKELKLTTRLVEQLRCPECEQESGRSAADLLGKDVAIDPQAIPKPTCAKCGEEMPYLYFYVYRLESTQGKVVFQASCCPHAGCRAMVTIQPIGIEQSPLAMPGKATWPGMPPS